MADHMTAEQISEELHAIMDCLDVPNLGPGLDQACRKQLIDLAARLSALPAQGVPDGWKLVPVIATDAMTQAWHEGSLNADPDGDYHGTPTISLDAMNRAGYAAMLAAAPLPPAPKANDHG